MIIKFQASDLSFQLATDTGDSIIDVAISGYNGEFNSEHLPTIQKELLSVAQQFVKNLSAAKAE